jgi:hypothetical protein
VVSITSIRRRARGTGSEFVLACDLRFASRENTLLGQWEVGVGVVPGGGPMARLSRLVGRGRALEILLVPAKLPICGLIVEWPQNGDFLFGRVMFPFASSCVRHYHNGVTASPFQAEPEQIGNAA